MGRQLPSVPSMLPGFAVAACRCLPLFASHDAHLHPQFHFPSRSRDVYHSGATRQLDEHNAFVSSNA